MSVLSPLWSRAGGHLSWDTRKDTPSRMAHSVRRIQEGVEWKDGAACRSECSPAALSQAAAGILREPGLRREGSGARWLGALQV